MVLMIVIIKVNEVTIDVCDLRSLVRTAPCENAKQERRLIRVLLCMGIARAQRGSNASEQARTRAQNYIVDETIECSAYFLPLPLPLPFLLALSRSSFRSK
jgi:hypothetical protein